MAEFFILAQQYIAEKISKLRGGEEVVKWIEYELETLIPQMERAEALSNQSDNNLSNTIRKAEVLADTYTKSVIRNKAANFWNPINSITIAFITKRLHKFRDEMENARAELSKSFEPARFALSFPFAPENHPATSDEQSKPSYLRRCIHYFLLFPPDFEVPARRLMALWVAEGLVRPKKHDDQSAEQIAERYLDELMRFGVEPVKKNSSGKVKTCRILAGKRKELLEEAKKVYFLEDRVGRIRRLVDHNGCRGAAFIQIGGDQKTFVSPKYRDAISLLSFNTQEGSKPGEDIGSFLRKCISDGCFIWLNVLDLERVFRPQLPDKLGRLIALKYLGLRWTYLEKLPDTVDRLLNLQVLDVKHTYISVLPRSIWSMEFLRHLYLSEAYRTRFPDPPSKVTLTALQTLWGAFVDEETCVEKGLDRLLNIRKLGLSCRSRASNIDEMSEKLKGIDKWISNLKHLESLSLKSRDDDGKAANLHLTSLEGNKNLSTVYLLGKLDRSILCELPVSLTDITLSGSELDLDPMGYLGRLPNLMILRLLGQSVVCGNMYCSKRGFSKLKILWIWKLENLKELEAEEGSLPSLEELEIRSCHNLENLPDRLRQLRNLKVKLTSMKYELLQKAGAKYAKVEHVAKDEQYILTNSSTLPPETEDLVSPCFIGYERSISRTSTSGSIF